MRMARTGTRGYWLLIGRAPTPPLQRKAINNCEQIKPFFLPSGLAWALSASGLALARSASVPLPLPPSRFLTAQTRLSRTTLFYLFPLSLRLFFSPGRCFPWFAFIERFRFVRAVSHDSHHCVRYFTVFPFFLFILLFLVLFRIQFSESYYLDFEKRNTRYSM